MDGAIGATQFGEAKTGTENAGNLLPCGMDWRAFACWSISAATAILAHGAIGALMLDWKMEFDASAPTATIVIELSPVLAAPEVPEMETPPAPEMVRAETPSDRVVEKDIEEPQKAVEETFEPALKMIEPRLKLTPEMAPLQPPEARQEVDVETTSQAIPVVVIEQRSEAELTPRKKRSDGKEIDAPRSVPADARPHEPPKPAKPAPNRPKKQAPDQIASKPQTAQVRQAATAQAPAASTPSNSSAAPNWRSEIIGILERNKRYPAEAEARQEHGVSNLAFSLNRQGRVTSARIAGSSGSATLDAETLALVHRVQPFPPPPPEVVGTQITLVVAVRYSNR
jgi:periplasmic protein TonB